MKAKAAAELKAAQAAKAKAVKAKAAAEAAKAKAVKASPLAKAAAEAAKAKAAKAKAAKAKATKARATPKGNVKTGMVYIDGAGGIRDDPEGPLSYGFVPFDVEAPPEGWYPKRKYIQNAVGPRVIA